MTSENFKDLNSRTAADKILRDKTFNIAKIKKYDGYESGFASTVLIFFDKKLQVVLFKKKLCKMTNQLKLKNYKPIIRKIEKRKVHSSFTDNICGADLADMQLISKPNKGFRFLISVIDIYNKYARVIPLKDKKGTTITNAFQKILDESN